MKEKQERKKNIKDNNNNNKENKLKLYEIEAKEIQLLEERIHKESPKPGCQTTVDDYKTFQDFPLSNYTKKGLELSKYIKPTQIQAGAIPHALAGRNIIASAKTGSGKTLAFLIPLLEKLYRLGFDSNDTGDLFGLGGLILTPTRELAIQIFNVLAKIGTKHSFSAGLIIGGQNSNNNNKKKTDFIIEQENIIKMNIIIATPGRFLQHCEMTPYFNINIQILILDEADRILDLGFSKQLTSILSFISNNNTNDSDRQTMLFSATQTKKLSDLIKLSLNNNNNKVEYIFVHEKNIHLTPSSLQQYYTIINNYKDKINFLFSFLRSKTKYKMIFFFSTCKNVIFYYNIFCKLQPGIQLLLLHGSIKQDKRKMIFDQFNMKIKNKNMGKALFCTDIAARGLDFPDIDWVVQMDIPEDVDTYIHRVGRTARYNKLGKSLLLMLKNEEKEVLYMIQKSKKNNTINNDNNNNINNIPIENLEMNPNKFISVNNKVCTSIISDKELKRKAEKAFVSYCRSIYLQPYNYKSMDMNNNDENYLFNLNKMDLNDLASSYGLALVPKLSFLSQKKKLNSDKEVLREELRKKKNKNLKLFNLKNKIKQEKEKRKLEKLNHLNNVHPTEEIIENNKMNHKENDDNEKKSNNDDTEFLSIKRKHIWEEDKVNNKIDTNSILNENSTTTNNKKKLKVLKKIRIDHVNESKKIFTDTGMAIKPFELLGNKYNDKENIINDDTIKQHEVIVKERLKKRENEDRLLYKERIKEKHKKEKVKYNDKNKLNTTELELNQSDNENDSENSNYEYQNESEDSGRNDNYYSDIDSNYDSKTDNEHSE